MSEGRRLSSHSCCGIDTIPNTYEDTGMKRALIIFVISIAYAGLAFADERVDGWLKRMDRNGDGVLVPDETTGLMKRHFARNDANGDGKLDKSELTALSKRLQQRGIAPNNQNQKRQAIPSDEAVRRMLPEGVAFVPNIAYRTGDASPRWKLDLFHPKAKPEGKRPGIVFVHGGGWKNGDKRRGTFLRGAIDYAAKGYVTISANYRLAGTDPLPACIEDVKCAVRWLRAHASKYHLDPDRLGAYGNSAGAHLVCMLGLAKKEAGLEGDGGNRDQSSLVQAVCASAPPTEFTVRGGNSQRYTQKGGLFAGPDEGLDRRMRIASPVTHVSAEAPPFLIIHGDQDRTVKIEHGDRLVEKLKDAGAKDVTYLRIKGAGHGVFNQHANKTKPAMEKFFGRVLK